MSDFNAWLSFAFGDSETEPGGEEGGWDQNDPVTDPPGQNPTYRGILFDEWKAWRGCPSLTQDDFRRMLTRTEIGQITNAGYWVPSHAGLLRCGAVLYIDHTFNAGLGGWRIKSAAWCLQTALAAVGVECGGADGVLGPRTTAAMSALVPPAPFINALAAARIANYRTKPQWGWAGSDWTRRTEHCRILALQLAGSPAQGG